MREDMELIAVVMGAESSKERFNACKQMLDFGFATYALITPTGGSAQIPVKLGTADFVGAIPAGKDAVLIEKAQKNGINQQIELIDTVDAPVSKGQRLGTLYIKSGEQVLKEIPMVAEQAVPRLTFGQIWRSVLQKLAMVA
jgi:D-alanyl-D-alanine carboxypeptidase (penicillin-binding protein 5/6)